MATRCCIGRLLLCGNFLHTHLYTQGFIYCHVSGAGNGPVTEPQILSMDCPPFYRFGKDTLYETKYSSYSKEVQFLKFDSVVCSKTCTVSRFPSYGLCSVKVNTD